MFQNFDVKCYLNLSFLHIYFFLVKMLDYLKIIMNNALKSRIMVKNTLVLGYESTFFHLSIKKLRKNIINTEKICTFVLDNIVIILVCSLHL